MTVKLSANLGFMWSELPLLDRIAASANAGFKAIELHWPYDTPPDLVRKACAQRELRLLSINTPVGREAGDAGLAAQPGREAEFRGAFKQTLDWAVESGACMIHVLPGLAAPSTQSTNQPQLQAQAQAQAAFLENLLWASELAAAQQITLLLEAINGRDKPGYFYHRQAESMAIINALKDKAFSESKIAIDNVKLMFDVYHVGVAEGDILKKLEHYLPHIGHIQIASVPNRAEPDEGEVRYEAVFEALSALGYKGWVGCEYRPRGDPQEGLRWVSAMGLAL